MIEDGELLEAYVREANEAAFESLVNRYLNLVYSAACRQTGDREQARDVTQAVFAILARKAGSLSSKTILSGWLYRTAHFVALEALRAAKRRKLREASMIQQTECEEKPQEVWEKVWPKLDAAMEQMNDTDRNAILLRFFQGKSYGEVAVALGVNETAAKKRVNRAVDRLRQFLSRRGITSSSSILGAALAANAVQPAPAAVASIAPLLAMKGATAFSAVSGSSTVQILTEGALEMIAWSKGKMAVCAAALCLVGGTVTVGVKYAREAAEHSRLTERQRALTSASTISRKEDAQVNYELARIQNENSALRQQAQEIHSLRARVSQLNARRRELLTVANSQAADVAPPDVRAKMENLRELQFEHFLAEGQKALELQPLTAEKRLEYNPAIDLMKNVGLALRVFASNNGDQFPTSLEPLVEKGMVTAAMNEKLQEGNFEYLVFSDAETKPGLPAVWTRSPDKEGIRILVLNDGSAHLIREPGGITPPSPVAMKNP
ncbi:MAG TPA: sigma-70 family RNA polymerase sigma factor [Verrucomicrobiae bacterium]